MHNISFPLIHQRIYRYAKQTVYMYYTLVSKEDKTVSKNLTLKRLVRFYLKKLPVSTTPDGRLLVYPYIIRTIKEILIHDAKNSSFGFLLTYKTLTLDTVLEILQDMLSGTTHAERIITKSLKYRSILEFEDDLLNFSPRLNFGFIETELYNSIHDVASQIHISNNQYLKTVTHNLLLILSLMNKQYKQKEFDVIIAHLQYFLILTLKNLSLKFKTRLLKHFNQTLTARDSLLEQLIIFFKDTEYIKLLNLERLMYTTPKLLRLYNRLDLHANTNPHQYAKLVIKLFDYLYKEQGIDPIFSIKALLSVTEKGYTQLKEELTKLVKYY